MAVEPVAKGTPKVGGDLRLAGRLGLPSVFLPRVCPALQQSMRLSDRAGRQTADLGYLLTLELMY
jgi:hypothetical protein